MGHLKAYIKFTKVFGIYSKLQMTLLILGGFVIGFMELAGLSVLFPLLNLLLMPDYMNQSGFIRALSRHTGVTDPQKMAMLVGFLIAMTFILKNIAQVLYLRYEFGVLTKWRVHINSRLYHVYMNSNYELFMRRSSSKMINLITGSVPLILNSFVHKILNLMNLALTCIVILSFVIFINWLITLLIVIIGLGLLLGYSRLFKAKSKTLGTRAQQLNGSQYALLQQSFTGYKETRTHLKEMFFSRKFSDTSEKLAKTEGRLYFLENLPPATVETVIMLLIIIVFETIILTGANIATASAQIGAIVLASLRMIPVINRTINSVLMINASRGVLDEMLEEVEKFNIEPAFFSLKKRLEYNEEEQIEALAFRDKIELAHVTYHYPESEKPALRDVNFTIRPGEFIGITGPSGGGKSTLTNILLGFLVSFEGEFTVDGVPVTTDNIRNFRKIVGFVDQQIFLMDVTIAENIAYGVDPEHIDRDKVVRSLQKAQLWDHVESLPDGIDTPIGENGKLLSGGQRQRLAIARALYKDLRLLILDEASASLDVETEYKLFAFLETLKGELAVIMIAHRLSTLQNCDRIIFMENGGIADQGNFDELYKSNHKFRNYIEYSQITINA
ncbi:MAG: hypothetical protein JWM96_924 [Alphaproteobacteria bacterium]|nr:hypothetical protein [Alphaproteobacteria bacterium]